MLVVISERADNRASAQVMRTQDLQNGMQTPLSGNVLSRDPAPSRNEDAMRLEDSVRFAPRKADIRQRIEHVRFGATRGHEVAGRGSFFSFLKVIHTKRNPEQRLQGCDRCRKE
jgi:hypothetical protein